MTSRSLRFGVWCAGFIAAFGVGAAAAQSDTQSAKPSDVHAGRVLAQHYCVQCHAISQTGKSRHPAAPPFRDLANSVSLDALSARFAERITTSHPDMPQWQFDAEQDRQIIAFLKSLQRKSPGRRAAPRAP